LPWTIFPRIIYRDFKYIITFELILGQLIVGLVRNPIQQIKANRPPDATPFLSFTVMARHLPCLIWDRRFSLIPWRTLGTRRHGWCSFSCVHPPKIALWSTLVFSGSFCVVASASDLAGYVTVFAGAVFYWFRFFLYFQLLSLLLWLERKAASFTAWLQRALKLLWLLPELFLD